MRLCVTKSRPAALLWTYILNKLNRFISIKRVTRPPKSMQPQVIAFVPKGLAQRDGNCCIWLSSFFLQKQNYVKVPLNLPVYWLSKYLKFLNLILIFIWNKRRENSKKWFHISLVNIFLLIFSRKKKYLEVACF